MAGLPVLATDSGGRPVDSGDEIEEPENREVVRIEGREAADPGTLERCGESGIENSLPSEAQALHELQGARQHLRRRVEASDFLGVPELARQPEGISHREGVLESPRVRGHMKELVDHLRCQRERAAPPPHLDREEPAGRFVPRAAMAHETRHRY